MNRVILILLCLMVCLSGCQFNMRSAAPTEVVEDSEGIQEVSPDISLSDEAVKSILNQQELDLVEYNRSTHFLKIDVTRLDFNRYDDIDSIVLLMLWIQKELKEETLTIVGVNRLAAHLKPATFELELKSGGRVLFKKINHMRFDGVLSAFNGANEIYKQQKQLFDANRLKIKRDGIVRLWKSAQGGMYIGFGMKNAPENFVTTVDGNQAYLTSLRGKLMDASTLDDVDESALNGKNEVVEFVNTENDCAILYHSKTNMVEWVDLLSGQRMVLNLSLLGEDVDMNSFKSVDKNKKRYMILKVNKPKTSEYVVHVPLDSNGRAIGEALRVSPSDRLESAEMIEGFVLQEE